MKTKGFTLIELLVVIVIIGILVAIALPNFIKIKDKAKEAEVKQNLHSIQLAIERYATDSGGDYPYFLLGGETLINIGTSNGIFSAGQGPLLNTWSHPFDMFSGGFDDPADRAWTYARGTAAGAQAVLDGDVESGWGDTLCYEAYMTKYPKNPFAAGIAAKQYSAAYFNSDANLTRFAGWGGLTGEVMFNVGPTGEALQIIRNTGSDRVLSNEMPGQFYYHPRWADGVTNHGHLVFQASKRGSATPDPAVIASASGYTPQPLDDSLETSSLDVAGYDLAAIGAPNTKGQDIDTTIFSSDFGDAHYMRTGYFTRGQERNPYVRAGGIYENARDFDERPFSDGVADYLIIHLSSGIDQKVSDNSQS